MIYDGYGNRRFYGLYRGVVVENNDPLNQYRLKLKVPQVLHDQTSDWAWSLHEPGVARSIPTAGVGVLVMFEGGDPSFPIWLGTSNAFNTGVYPVSNLNYGSFSSTQDQTILGVSATKLTLNNTDEANNVTIDGSKINFQVSATYNIQFSIQLENGGVAEHEVFIWGTLNGTPVANSVGAITLTPKGSSDSGKAISSWNYVLTVNSGDYFELNARTDPTAGSAGIIIAAAHPDGDLNQIDIPTGAVSYNATTGFTRVSVGTANAFSEGDTVYIKTVVPTGYRGTWVAQAGTTNSYLYIKTNSNLGSITTKGTASAIPGDPSLIVTVTQVK